MNIDYEKLMLEEDRKFGLFMQEVMNRLTGMKTEEWLMKAYKAYNDGANPQELVDEIRGGSNAIN